MSKKSDVQDVRDVAQAKLGDTVQGLRDSFENEIVLMRPEPKLLKCYDNDWPDAAVRGNYVSVAIEAMWRGYQLGHSQGMRDSNRPMWIESNSQAAEQIKRDAE